MLELVPAKAELHGAERASLSLGASKAAVVMQVCQLGGRLEHSAAGMHVSPWPATARLLGSLLSRSRRLVEFDALAAFTATATDRLAVGLQPGICWHLVVVRLPRSGIACELQVCQ